MGPLLAQTLGVVQHILVGCVLSDEVRQPNDSSHMPISEVPVALVLVVGGICQLDERFTQVTLLEQLLPMLGGLVVLEYFLVYSDNFELQEVVPGKRGEQLRDERQRV